MSSKKFNPFKDFHTDQIQRSSRKMFTAHYAHRNADLNLTLVLGTTNSGGSGEGPAPPYFWTKLRLEGPKKYFLETPSHPSPLIEGSG